MSSFKRVLNHPETEYHVSERSASSRMIQISDNVLDASDNIDFNMRHVGDTSWGTLYGSLLQAGTDMEDENSSSSPNDISSASTQSILTAGLEIEEWAETNLNVDPSDEPPVNGHISQPLPDQEYCYGMIQKIAVRLSGDMTTLDNRLRSESHRHPNSNSSTTVFNISESNDRQETLNIQFPDGNVFGHLNMHASKALKPLMSNADYADIKLEAFAVTKTLINIINRAKKATEAAVKVNINVYGPQSRMNTVADQLCQSKHWLQMPFYRRANTIYRNPHILEMSEFLVHVNGVRENLQAIINKTEPRQTIQQQLDRVFLSLKRNEALREIEGDARLVSSLLAHQKQALDFMLQREFGPVEDEFSLWKRVEGRNTEGYYHAITDTKSGRREDETGGGILADEMGMGKTLSTLALISKTLEKAELWPHADALNFGERQKQLCSATLVIVPSGILINNWANEVKIHYNNKLNVLSYHRQRHKKNILDKIQEVDIVITTYHTLAREFEEQGPRSPLHQFTWYRVVLDEAHFIRRQTTTFYRSVFELEARSRWCLAGTPVQNKLEDIGALFVFIRASGIQNMAIFRKYISIPFTEGSADHKELAKKKLTCLLDSTCIRRTKKLLDLPDREDQVRKIELSDAENIQYKQTSAMMKRRLSAMVGEIHPKGFFGLFHIQLQLRILCNHGTWQDPFIWARRNPLDEADEAYHSVIGSSGQVKCALCTQLMPIEGSSKSYSSFSTQCTHALCSECLDKDDEDITDGRAGRNRTCPICVKQGISTETLEAMGENSRSEHYFRDSGHSSKLTAVIDDVKVDLTRNKSVIFSCWTHTLDLLELHLKKANISFRRIDGANTTRQRQSILDEFADKESEVRVLIMTTGTGAFGLNLTSANRVFIVEPQWNPSVESQAIARALRIGQEEKVLVIRYIVKDTIEYQMMSQQRKKMELASLTNVSSTQLEDVNMEDV